MDVKGYESLLDHLELVRPCPIRFAKRTGIIWRDYQMKRWVIAAVFVGTLSSWATPQGDHFPKFRGWVNDFARVIPSAYEEKMELLAGEVKRKTGVEMAVVTVENMGGLAVEDYAYKLYQAWGIGERGKDNGVLFLLASQEKKVRIEVGYDLEGILPDGICGEILDRYPLPDFRVGNYGLGFYRGMLAVTGVIAKDAGVQITGSQGTVRRTRSSERSRGGGIFFIVLFVLLMILTRGRILPWLFLGMMMGGGGRGGGFSGGFGGGFGGFGGGMSGGGGASRGF